MTERTIGIIGGTGPQGKGLAMRLALAGLRVRVGSRQAERGRRIAAEMNGQLQAHAAGGTYVPLEGGENGEIVAGSPLVFLTVPFDSAAGTLNAVKTDLQPGAVLVDVTVPLVFGKGDVQVTLPPEGSGSRHLRVLLPEGVALCGACKTLPAHVLEDLALPLGCDTFVFGDDKAAKAQVMDVLSQVPGLRPLDVGGLSAAATVEGMTALLIRINRRMKSREGRFRVVGI